jgi:hypothetical protein
VLGDFKVEELERSNRILGPAFFVLWTLITTLLLLNIFIAIVVDAYDRVRQQVIGPRNTREIVLLIQI